MARPGSSPVWQWWSGAVLLALLVAPASAAAQWFTTVDITNGTGFVVDDLHMEFLGTGGTVRNVSVLSNPAGAGAASASGSGAQVNILWAAPGLPGGSLFRFQFETTFQPIRLNTARWTRTRTGQPDIPVDTIRDGVVLSTVPEPISVVPIGAGLVMLGMIARKRHFAASQF